MKTAVLDLTGCRGWDEFHERIQKALGFPDYYGHNWSAFSDCMSFDFDGDKLIIIGEKQLPKAFEKQIKIMHEILDREIEERDRLKTDNFTYETVD